jgi:hypothetical protein
MRRFSATAGLIVMGCSLIQTRAAVPTAAAALLSNPPAGVTLYLPAGICFWRKGR